MTDTAMNAMGERDLKCCSIWLIYLVHNTKKHSVAACLF